MKKGTSNITKTTKENERERKGELIFWVTLYAFISMQNIIRRKYKND